MSGAGLPDPAWYKQTPGASGADQSLDQIADALLVELLGESGHLGLLVSEARDTVVATAVSQLDAEYVIAIDPLDGISNLGSNIPVGTCFAIYRKKNRDRQALLDDFLQSGRNIVAAGYAIYGAKTEFVCSMGSGVFSFTLDPGLGEFILTRSNLTIPASGPWYSVNEGYTQFWQDSVRQYVESLKSTRVNGKPAYGSRYIGSLVADFDRTLRQGGVFMHPANGVWPNGKLHLLYECAPLAFLVEQAGGMAVSGLNPVLDCVPKNIHERCPVILGSPHEVGLYLESSGAPAGMHIRQ